MAKIARAFALIVLIAAARLACAADISIGLGSDVTSIDPHYHNLSPNNNIAQHIFDSLVTKDARARLIPGLAESWRSVDDLTWEFKLRKGVKFHDGSDFTAADVAFTIERAPTVPNSPPSFANQTAPIKEVIVVDPYTVRFRTATPYPLMPNDMSTLVMISSKAAKGAGTEDFNSGRAAIGTGPFKFVRYAKGDRIELARNDQYWGARPAWSKVTFRLITSDPTRVAALLAGDVQAIENVPTSDLARLVKSPAVNVYRIVSYRLMYLHIDGTRERSPFVTDKADRKS